MAATSAPGGRYSMDNVLDYILQVEQAYGLSLKFWIDIRLAAESHPALYVYVWGSGDVLDLIPLGQEPPRCRVWDEGPGELLAAIYLAVFRLEQIVSTLREPVAARPALRRATTPPVNPL